MLGPHAKTSVHSTIILAFCAIVLSACVHAPPQKQQTAPLIFSPASSSGPAPASINPHAEPRTSPSEPPSPPPLAESWKAFETINGVTLYRKDIPGAPLPAYRAVGEFHVSIGKLARLCFDVSYHARWMAKIRIAQVIREISPTEKIEHIVLGTPWPISDRDAVVRLKMTTDEAKHQVTLDFESTEDSLAPEPGTRVRAWMYPSKVVFTELPHGKTRVEAEANVDPRGFIPRWMILIYQKNIPRITLRRIYENALKADVHPLPLWKDEALSE